MLTNTQKVMPFSPLEIEMGGAPENKQSNAKSHFPVLTKTSSLLGMAVIGLGGAGLIAAGGIAIRNMMRHSPQTGPAPSAFPSAAPSAFSGAASSPSVAPRMAPTSSGQITIGNHTIDLDLLGTNFHDTVHDLARVKDILDSHGIGEIEKGRDIVDKLTKNLTMSQRESMHLVMYNAMGLPDLAPLVKIDEHNYGPNPNLDTLISREEIFHYVLVDNVAFDMQTFTGYRRHNPDCRPFYCTDFDKMVSESPLYSKIESTCSEPFIEPNVTRCGEGYMSASDVADSIIHHSPLMGPMQFVEGDAIVPK